MVIDNRADGALAQCCMCGKTDLSTAEDGGPECELHDGRWVCSSECWDIAVSIIDRLLVSRPAETALAAMAEREGVLRSACAPFKDMAGEMFARNWNRDQVAIALDNPGDLHRLTFGDFLDLHAAIKGPQMPVEIIFLMTALALLLADWSKDATNG